MGMPEYHDGTFGPIKPIDEAARDLIEKPGEKERTKALHVGSLEELSAKIQERNAAIDAKRAFIKPTIGRVVWFYKYSPGQGHKGPLAALIAWVHNDDYVNLMVCSDTGEPRPETSVYLIQDEKPGEEFPFDFCTWMPYQKGQAAKTERLEQLLKTSEAQNGQSPPQEKS